MLFPGNIFLQEGEGNAAGDLNRDTFSSKNQGVDGPGARAEHGKTDGENGDENVTLVLCGA